MEGRVEIRPELIDGLRDLEGFSHIVLIYHLHLSQGFSLLVKPFLDDEPRGVFATRAPRRPNAIGLSVVRLVAIDSTTLRVRDVEIVDGTPLLDLKPHIPEANPKGPYALGWLTGKTWKLASTRSDDRFECFQSAEVGQKTGFDEEGTGLAARFADQAAIAIRHALLHQQHEKLVILEERQKLAHELHDSATQSIYGVTMYGEAAARLLEANQVEKASTILRDLQETALDALRKMRLLVFELRPPMLEKEGLAAALQARLSAVEGRAGLATEFSADNMAPPPSRVSEALYGITKEALNNVLKHAGASRVAIRLQKLESAIALEITDDGAGFEPALANERGGLGLQGMKERAAGIGAHLTLSSRPGNGTTVRVEVALPDTMKGSGVSEGTI